jgi:hypothetical protein
MSEQVIEQVTGESDNLQLHVELCQQRYLQLCTKFDVVDLQLDQLKVMLKEVHDKLTNNKSAQLETYLKWAGAIIMTFSGVIAGLFMHLFTRS